MTSPWSSDDPVAPRTATSQVIEWALRDKPFERAYLEQDDDARLARSDYETLLWDLADEHWIRPVSEDDSRVWYPGVRAVLLRGFDFPTPDTDGCVAVVAAVHDHLLAEEPASTETLRSGVDLQDHVVGPEGAQRMLVGDHDAYRQWLWRDVLSSALPLLPEVDPPPGRGTAWTVGEITAAYSPLRVSEDRQTDSTESL